MPNGGSGGGGGRSMTFGIEVKENEGAKERRKEESLFSFYFFSGKSCEARGAAAFARWDGSGRAAALI